LIYCSGFFKNQRLASQKGEQKMLDQLVESKNNGKETAKRAKFLGTTFVLVVSFAFSGVLWSLFAKDIAMGNEQMELSTLVAPVNLPETKPQPPEPRQNQPKSAIQNSTKETSRQANILRLDETPKVPTTISVVPNTQKERPNTPFRLSPNAPESDFQSTSKIDRNTGENTGEIGKITPPETEKTEVIKTTPPIPPPLNLKATPPVKDKIISIGVVNGKATNLPKPIYSAAAKAVNAMGDVNVQITIDERGNVISAKAVNGHPLLRADSEKAARNAKFSPTLLSNQPVKVTGVIVYKFSK
jgi:periplasmic protein TonB